jgi:hypothetical protein
MNPMSDIELRINQQAATVAASVLSEPVEAATRCQQVTRDMGRKASGFGGFTRAMARANDAIGRATPGTMGQMSRQMETAGLPNSFVLAITRTHVHALEEKLQGDTLVPGRVLKSWDRAGFQARRGNDRANAFRGVPDNRQVLILFLPIEGGHSRIVQAAARNTAAAGSPGFPHQVMVAKDAPSQRVIEVLGANSGGPNISIGGQANIAIGGRSLQDLIAEAASAQPQAAAPTAPPSYAPAQPSTAQRLQELEALRATGVITDAEYAHKREQIIAEL